MPTRKQRRREAKHKRHEYETVWVDSEGNEVDEPTEDAERGRRRARDGEATRSPPRRPRRASSRRADARSACRRPPSWQRRRAARARILGAVVFALFYSDRPQERRSILSPPLSSRPLHRPLHPVHVRGRPLRVPALPDSKTRRSRSAAEKGKKPFAEALTGRRPQTGVQPAADYTRPAMSLAVDRYALGPLQTNCYVVRASRGAARGGRRRPGRRRRELRLELARPAPRCAGILVTHGHFDHLGGVADLAEGTGAPGLDAGGRARPARALPGVRARPARPAARTRPTTCSRAARRSSSRASPSSASPSPATRRRTSPSTPTARSSAATCSSPARSAASTCPAPTGTRCSTPSARSSTATRRRPSSTRATARRRRSARSSPATRTSRSCARERHEGAEDRGAARHARHPAGRAAALAEGDGGDGAPVRALRLPAHPDTRVRGRRPLPAHVRPGLGHRPEGDVHLRGPERPLARAPARGHGADLPRLPRARDAPRAAAGEALHARDDVPLRQAPARALPRALPALRRGASAPPTRRSTPR